MWFFKRGVILVEGYINLRAGMKERFYRGRERGGQSLLSTGVVSGLIRVACPHGCSMLLALLCDAFSVFFFVAFMWWFVSVQQKAIRTRRSGRMRKRHMKMKFPKRRKRKDKCSEYFCCLCVCCVCHVALGSSSQSYRTNRHGIYPWKCKFP